MTGRDEALAKLAAHHANIEATRRQLADLEAATIHHVADCRQHDATWQQIADTLGRNRSNVHTDYAKRIEETRTVRVKPTSSEEKP